MTKSRYQEIKAEMERLYDASLLYGGTIAQRDAYFASLSATEQAQYKAMLADSMFAFPEGN